MCCLVSTLLPLLDNNTTSLEIRQFTQNSRLVCQLFAGECSHQYPGARLARWAARCHKGINIANSMGGIEAAGSGWDVRITGVGLPSRCPEPAKGLYFGLGRVYFSSCCLISTSTSWPGATFIIDKGARPRRIPSSMLAFWGSSDR